MYNLRNAHVALWILEVKGHHCVYGTYLPLQYIFILECLASSCENVAPVFHVKPKVDLNGADIGVRDYVTRDNSVVSLSGHGLGVYAGDDR